MMCHLQWHTCELADKVFFFKLIHVAMKTEKWPQKTNQDFEMKNV